MMIFGYGLHGYGAGFLIMALVMVAVAVFVILGIIALIRYIRASGHAEILQGQVSGTNSALQILDERYAKGEIADEEYKTKKKNSVNNVALQTIPQPQRSGDRFLLSRHCAEKRFVGLYHNSQMNKNISSIYENF